MPGGPLVRIREAPLGATGTVRLAVSGVSDPSQLRVRWASSGASVQEVNGRLEGTTTIDALARAAGRSLAPAEAERLEVALRRAAEAWEAPAPRWELRGGAELELARRPALMGIVNVTPDSFSDGGLLYPDGHPRIAVAHARRLADEGADLLDIGGESTRPGAASVGDEEELARILPVLEALAPLPVPCSVDTRKARVAEAALRAGAAVVNDVSGGRDRRLLDVVAEQDAAYVLMHTRGTPADMTSHAHYDDVVADVYEFLAEGLERCAAAGIPEQRIVVDPGLGFAKDAGHNLRLLGALRQLRGLGRPVLVGASRKSFLGKVLDGAGPADRVAGSLACVALAVAAGAAVVRVHDVAPSVDVARVTHAVLEGGVSWPVIVDGRA